MNNNQLVAIEVNNVSKEYRLAGGNEKKFRALHNVSFTINKGDVVGIIGNNGSGKSTLLKILSQITKPSNGKVSFAGSVTSILEIGTNFHPDLTGRENVKLHLKLEGISKTEYSRHENEIMLFSDVGSFFDQPVKFYSSGMFLRLAFSMAFHLAFDILLLDEVLSVGDEGFRLKCQDMLKKLTQQGKTILFVSHNRIEILELANKCIWLEQGCIRKEGNAALVLSEYFALQREAYEEQKNIIETHHPERANSENFNGAVKMQWTGNDAPGNDVMAVRELSVISAGGSETLLNTEAIQVKFVIEKKKPGIQIGAFFFLQDVFYQPVMVGHFLNNTHSIRHAADLKNFTGLFEITCLIPANFLVPGKYYLLPRLGMEKDEWNENSEEAFRFSEKLNFTIHPADDYVDFIGDIGKGSVRPPLDWNIKKLTGSA